MQYTFDRCRLDTGSREFTRDGTPVHLSPKAFDLLCVLLAHRPRVMSKADLMAMLWPDTFVVEANLPVLVGELRTAFGDRAGGSSAIRTHHGIGYSFAASVTEKHDEADVINGSRLLLKVGERRISLSPGVNLVGRDVECDVVINDASVSRRHARIDVAQDGVTLTDLGSKNKTKVGDMTVAGEPVTLRDGDEILFGKIRAQFHIVPERDPASTLTL